MGLSTFAELKDSVGGWLNRRDLDAVIPDFITLFEADVNRKLRVRQMLARDVMVTPSADTDYENLPDDFLQLKMVRFNTDPAGYPTYATPDMIGFWRSKHCRSGGAPGHYSILGTQILFDRVPTGSPEMELLSYVRIPALNNTTQQSNGLLIAAPDLYLYGTLLQAEPYLKNDARLDIWAGLYGAAIEALQVEDKKAETSPSPLVARPKRSF